MAGSSSTTRIGLSLTTTIIASTCHDRFGAQFTKNSSDPADQRIIPADSTHLWDAIVRSAVSRLVDHVLSGALTDVLASLHRWLTGRKYFFDSPAGATTL